MAKILLPCPPQCGWSGRGVYQAARSAATRRRPSGGPHGDLRLSSTGACALHRTPKPQFRTYPFRDALERSLLGSGACCPDGGIGRRKGLKRSLCRQRRAGSSPAPGTLFSQFRRGNSGRRWPQHHKNIQSGPDGLQATLESAPASSWIAGPRLDEFDLVKLRRVHQDLGLRRSGEDCEWITHTPPIG